MLETSACLFRAVVEGVSEGIAARVGIDEEIGGAILKAMDSKSSTLKSR